jgi:prepilin-type N-terminal cleavage/methylation domain-containing protein
MDKSYSNSGGFTLIELMIGMVILSIVIAIASFFFVFFFRNYDFSFEQGRTIDQAKGSLTRMTAELREARSSDEGAYALVVAEDSEIVFFANVDSDLEIEKVRYYLEDGVFYRGVVEPQSEMPIYDNDSEVIQIISEFVTNDSEPVFYYYNDLWPGDAINNPLIQTERLLHTRMVKVNLNLNTDPDMQQDFNLSTQTTLRNLKTN